jgi:O-antigen/teichoic acid export membrane protein
MNFVIGIVLIRWASKTVYGEYSLAFAIILFITSIYNVLINLPINITGVKIAKVNRYTFIGSHCIVLYITVIPIALLALVLLYIIPESILPIERITASVLFISAIGILSRELVRTLNFVDLRTNYVLYTDLLYVTLLSASIAYLFFQSAFNASTIIGAMGVSSAIAAVVFLKSVRDSFKVKLSTVWGDMKKSWQDSRWLLGGGLQAWIVNQGFLFILVYVLSREDVAQVNATRVVLAPLSMMFVAWGKVFTPKGSRLVAQNQIEQARRAIIKSTVEFSFVVIIYVLILLGSSNFLTTFLYKGKYFDITAYILLWGGFNFANNIRLNIMHLLGVLSKFKLLFVLGLVNASISLVLCYVLIKILGAFGAIIALIFSEALLALMFWIAFYNQRLAINNGYETTGNISIRSAAVR